MYGGYSYGSAEYGSGGTPSSIAIIIRKAATRVILLTRSIKHVLKTSIGKIMLR